MDIIENEEADKDIVEESVVEELFSKKYDLITETEVSLKTTYINKLSGTKNSKFSVILPDNTIEVYELNGSSMSRVCLMSGHEKTVTEAVFNPTDDNLLFSTSEDGLVKMWDTRAGGSCVLDYKDEEEKIIRPYECMDVSYNGRVLCTGSQLVEDDAYLVFWDQRVPKPLGGYWNSHTDDITQVKFHKEKVEILATGSLDGLVNVFNIMEQTEDDALTHTLNAECAVDKLAWLGNAAVACVTQSNDLQLWNTSSGNRTLAFPRDQIATSIKRSRADDCYLVDTLASVGGRPVLLAGSFGGDEKTLRSVMVSNKQLVPYANFGRNRQIVRCCWYDKPRDLLVTAGEAGIISVWRGVPAHDGIDDAEDADDEEGEDGEEGGDGAADADERDDDTDASDDSDESEDGDNSEDTDRSDDKSDDSDNSEDTDKSEDSEKSTDSDRPEESETRDAPSKPENSNIMQESDDSEESSETEGGDGDVSQDDVSGKLTGALARLQANRHKPY